jgi:hypothetical protein
VDLVLSYSNHADLLSPLTDVLERINAGDSTAYPGVLGRPQRAAPSSPAPQTHVLTDDQLSAIFWLLSPGVGPRELSRRYGVTERAIKYLLKKHGVQRQRGGGDPLGSQPSLPKHLLTCSESNRRSGWHGVRRVRLSKREPVRGSYCRPESGPRRRRGLRLTSGGGPQ